VFSDSQSFIHLTKNYVYHSKITHISVNYHHIRDIIATGEIVVKKIYTWKNPANMLTKPLLLAEFEHYLDLIGVHNV